MHIAYQFWENTAVVLLTGFPEGLFTLAMISYLLYVEMESSALGVSPALELV